MALSSILQPETQRILEDFASINNQAFWVWDLETNKVSRFGKDFYKAFGRGFTALTSPEDWINLIHPDDRERVATHFKACQQNPETRETEDTYLVLRTDGTYADILDKAFIIRGENGLATSVFGIAADITFRKKNDIEREIMLGELIKANSDLKQFSYITTHNLRTPIANLIALGNMIDETKIEDPLTRKAMGKYKEAALQLNKNVNDLLELLIQNNGKENQVREIALDEIFKQVTASVETKIVACGAAIRTDFSACNTVKLNPGYLHSIFLNFLTNSLKYRDPARKLQVKVFTETKEDKVLLHFADNGLGIDLDKYGDKVFGLYQHFHDHPDSKGLGLHIVATQVKAMGGEVWVNSEPDKGTTFTVQFKK